MMIRLLIFLLATVCAASASEPIDAPIAAASATVKQPHVTAELIPEKTLIEAGKSIDVILHLKSDPEWHTYWINPGDAGLATSISWTLPPGFTAGPIQWPTPEKHNMGPLITYGYGGDVYLITTITAPTSIPKTMKDIAITAKAQWLVCKEECIPGKGEFTVNVHFKPKGAEAVDYKFASNRELFFQARERLPVPGDFSKNKATYLGNSCVLNFVSLSPISAEALKTIRFFPEQSNVLSTTDNPKAIAGKKSNEFSLTIKLEQNGETPDKLSGVLVSDQILMEANKAVWVPGFEISTVAAAVPSGGSASPSGGPDNSLSGSPQATGSGQPQTAAPAQGPATATLPSANALQPENSSASTTEPAAQRAAATSETAPQPLLIAVLGAAFVGGLILNLMPCVLPVLSLKVFSLMKHAGENPKAAWLQGVAFTAGVVLSFWALAGLLLALRSAGNHLGWGFQMQSPGFVLGLIFLFFLLGLNLFGVFELGSSLVGLDAKATNRLGGLASSFGNGALATLAATPCTAPFMGSALGFAAQQPGYISMLIFTFLALGMASPYLLLTIFPGALRFVPKPGAWMEAFKQFMGFLLMATVIFLVYVFGALRNAEAIPELLFYLLFVALLAWVYGRWGARFVLVRVLTIALLVLTFVLLEEPPASSGLKAEGNSSDGHRPPLQGEWQPWSQSAVDAAVAKGQPVFVDFTAAWCLSCKVNERVALGTDSVKKAFADKNVALFKADWTHSDPEISKTLQKFNRDGVPLYLLYSPKDAANPQVLPEVLTPGIVLDAVGKL